MVGERIKALRASANLTQAEFAEALNEKYGLHVERSMVSKWEHNTQSPVIYTISCIANFFGVTIDELTGDKKEPSIPDGKDKELWIFIQKLDDKNLDKALDYLQLLYQSQTE